MTAVFTALARALESLLQARMLLLCITPLLLALLVWLLIGGLAWHDSWQWMHSSLESQPWATRVEPPPWMGGMMTGFGQGLLAAGTTLMLLMVLVPAVWMTMLLIAALIAMPWMVRHVASRDYPSLERLHGGSFFGSLWNAVWAVAVFSLLWLLSLPLWLLAGAGALIGLLLTGWVTQRLLRYDALADHASRAERVLIFDRASGQLWLLGVVLTLLALVPVVNLVLPVYAGLAVIHLCLGALEEIRRDGPIV
ncbi:MAG: EI24 domain-containing protein [Burkholderiales bacterium]